MLNSTCEVRNIGVEQIVRLKELPSSRALQCQDGRVPQSPKLFVYCSTPRPLVVGKIGTPRPAYRNNVPKPEGWHSYYNISWDPHVRRGDARRRSQMKREEEECEKIRQKLNQPRRSSGRTIRRQLMERKKTVSDPDTMIRTAKMRYARLAISNLKEKDPDIFTLDLADELEQDEDCLRGNKMGGARALPVCPSGKKTKTDQASQILPSDFFDFDREVIPVLERLVGSVTYQARLEVLQEEEFNALRHQQEIFQAQTTNQLDEGIMLKDQLERQMSERKRLLELAKAQNQEAKDKMFTFSLFGGVYVKYEDSSLNLDLEQLEVLKGATRDFKSWLNSEVERQMELHFESNKFLDGLLRRVMAEKEAAYAVDVWKPFFAEERVRTYSDELESSRVPPPTPGSSEYYTSDEETGNLRSLMSATNYMQDDI